jgi:hypothetical protein
MKSKYFLMIILIIGSAYIYSANAATNDTKLTNNFYIVYNNITGIDNSTGKLEIYYNYIDDEDNQKMKVNRYYVRNNVLYSYIDDTTMGDITTLNNKTFTINFYSQNVSCSDIKLTELSDLMEDISTNLVACRDSENMTGTLAMALASCDNPRNVQCQIKQNELNNKTSEYTKLNADYNNLQNLKSTCETEKLTCGNSLTKAESNKWLYAGGGALLIGIIGYFSIFGPLKGTQNPMKGDFARPGVIPLNRKDYNPYGGGNYPSNPVPNYPPNQPPPSMPPNLNIQNQPGGNPNVKGNL